MVTKVNLLLLLVLMALSELGVSRAMPPGMKRKIMGTPLDCRSEKTAVDKSNYISRD